ncbi:uncharacterized protein LOC130769734 isoform X2 [Actinidia eriantha]|uniref:uncharacterized protein LOC130769734 isoform X2 n=1 Tax=Actinidia eriantha TaxID=165200 RepID=UPI0025879A6E|nr:uncharacterized protein LOC130769734 isoform X2 [Actinidia eriantha]
MLASPITSPLCNPSTIRTDNTRKTFPLATSPTTTAEKARHCSFLSIRTKPHPVLFSSRSSDSLFSPSQQNKADEKEPGPDCLKEIFYPTVKGNVDLKRGNSCGPACNERGKCVETTLQDGDSQKEILTCRTNPAAASRSAFLGVFLMGFARWLFKLMNGDGIKNSSGPQPRPPPPTWEGHPPALIFPAPSQKRPQPPKTRRPAVTSLDPDPSIRPPREENELCLTRITWPPRPTFKDRSPNPRPLIIKVPHDPQRPPIIEVPHDPRP